MSKKRKSRNLELSDIISSDGEGVANFLIRLGVGEEKAHRFKDKLWEAIYNKTYHPTTCDLKQVVLAKGARSSRSGKDDSVARNSKEHANTYGAPDCIECLMKGHSPSAPPVEEKKQLLTS